MNSKTLIHITLSKIFENYEKDIQKENTNNYILLNNALGFDDVKNNKEMECYESGEENDLKLNIDINIKPEYYKGKKKVINKMKLKLLQLKKFNSF
jgi:hypothetical protein